ncbi:MAG: hypothetical protein WDZ69_01115 [Candidatus Pacearchaeota archaeon]
MRNNHGFQMSFAWLFAIIAGGFILFLAIYGVAQIVDTSNDVSDARAGAEIGVLLNPLETGFESGQVNFLTMPLETIIHNRCSSSGTFGEQRVRVSQKTRGSWSETNLSSRFENKYIFSEGDVEGRNFFLFSKPFNFPFKISDVIYMTSADENYCFSGFDGDAEEDIRKELSDLKKGNENWNVFIEGGDTGDEECPAESINVCFGGSSEVNCDVNVRYGRSEVQKDSGTMYFAEDALMYAAIFSEPSIYECQVERLMKRADELSTIYNQKESFLSSQGCTSNNDILQLRNAFREVQTSKDLLNIKALVRNVDDENSGARCKLW